MGGGYNRVSAKGLPKSKKVSVLMIGNSLTNRWANHTRTYLKGMANSAGRKISISYIAHSNEKMKNYANRKTAHGREAYRKIASRKWTYIILQENTDYAIAHGKVFQRSAKKLAAYIHKKSPRTQIIYNCTWAYDKVKTISGKRYSYKTQQKRMNAKYRKVAEATGGKICWSGNAFMAYRKTKNARELYLPDRNHATSYGWFLNAASLYAAIFQASPAESSYTGGLGKATTSRMKKIAWQENKPAPAAAVTGKE